MMDNFFEEIDITILQIRGWSNWSKFCKAVDTIDTL